MGWRELCDQTVMNETSWVDSLRIWFLLGCVALLAGWGAIDIALRTGNTLHAANGVSGAMDIV